MSKEEMTQFSLIIKEAIKESQGNLEKQFISFKNDVNSRFDKIDTRLDGIEGRLDKIENRLDRIENTPTMKKELGL